MPHDIRVNPERNRVYLKLVGLFSDEEAQLAANEIIVAFSKMLPGFTCVTDISAFRPLTQDGVKEIRRAAEAGRGLGMSATVRVLGASAVAAQQFARSAVEVGFVALTAATVEEADAMLDARGRKH